MPATSSRSTYRKTRREVRGNVVEPLFGSMTYSDNPLPPGQVHTIVNMIQKDYGKRARPRGGMKPVLTGIDLGSALSNPYVFSTGVIIVKDKDTDTTALRRYSLIVDYPAEHKNKHAVPFTNSRIVIELPAKREYGPSGTVTNASVVLTESYTGSDEVIQDPRLELVEIDGMAVDAPTPRGVFAEINGNLYVMSTAGLMRVDVSHTGGTYTHTLEAVHVEIPNPSKAMQSGYNMLSDSPYMHENTIGAVGEIQGIVPYDPANPTTVKLQGHLGDDILFRVVYKYETGKNYKIKWETLDLMSRESPELLRSAEDSPSYTDGADATYIYRPDSKQFKMIATLYDATNLNEPLHIFTVTMYDFLKDTSVVMNPVLNYDFKTAKDMMEWKNQIVVYGIDQAETGVFISAVNDPTYFPYPYNFIDTGERVIACTEYMGELGIATENSLYIATMAEVGYTLKKVQSGLEIREQDRGSIFAVRNLIHLKSNGKYYMIVPDLRNDQGNLQVAPITEPIQPLFDNLKVNLYDIVNTVYNIGSRFQTAESLVDFALLDYRCIQDGSRMRNVFRLKFTNQTDTVLYLDVHIIYDTIFRNWYMEMYESTKAGMFLFKTLATGYAEFLSLSTNGDSTMLEWIRIDERVVTDTFRLDEGKERVLKNRQCLDTGKRDMSGELKKRFRHIILEFNNLQKEAIEFNHQFLIDDEERSDLYVYEVKQITDPEDPAYGQIYIDRTYKESERIAGTTKLNTWVLGESQLPDVTVVKAHLDVSGKGYYPRFKVVTTTPRLYELNNITWVWRSKNAR